MMPTLGRKPSESITSDHLVNLHSPHCSTKILGAESNLHACVSRRVNAVRHLQPNRQTRYAWSLLFSAFARFPCAWPYSILITPCWLATATTPGANSSANAAWSTPTATAHATM